MHLHGPICIRPYPTGKLTEIFIRPLVLNTFELDMTQGCKNTPKILHNDVGRMFIRLPK